MRQNDNFSQSQSLLNHKNGEIMFISIIIIMTIIAEQVHTELVAPQIKPSG